MELHRVIDLGDQSAARYYTARIGELDALLVEALTPAVTEGGVFSDARDTALASLCGESR